jgi:hypothetical protein
MSALLRKEVAPFLAPACVLALLFTFLLCWILDGDEPSRTLFPLVFLLSVNAGAILGYVQLAKERDGDTLAYLLHRERTPRSLIMAKCAAGWALLALVLHLPLVLFALFDPGDSPFGPLVRLGKVCVLLLACLSAVPALALGLFCAALPLAPRTRRILVLLAAHGLSVLALSGLTAELWTSTLLISVSCAALTIWLASSACARLRLIDDLERAQPPARLLSEFAVLVLLLVVPGHLLLSRVQFAVMESAVRGRPSIVWDRDHGPRLVDRDQRQWRVSYPDGTTSQVVDVIWSWRSYEFGSMAAHFATADLGPADGHQAPVYAQADGDMLVSTVRVVDAATGETVMVQRYSLEGMGQWAAAALAFGSSLLFAPAAVLRAHLLEGEGTAWRPSLAGLVVGHGRRPWFVVLNAALAMALALHERRSLGRRGAEAWRQRLWFAVVLVFGPAGWLCCRLLEPRTFPAGAVRQTHSGTSLVMNERAGFS